MTILRSRPQYRDSYAAPHPPNPPPTIKMSASTNFVFLAIASGLPERRQRVDVERRRLVCEKLRRERAHVGQIVFGGPLDRTPRRGPDRECEFLQPAVAVADLPRD